MLQVGTEVVSVSLVMLKRNILGNNKKLAPNQVNSCVCAKRISLLVHLPTKDNYFTNARVVVTGVRRQSIHLLEHSTVSLSSSQPIRHNLINHSLCINIAHIIG